jgi:hypothetical protein
VGLAALAALGGACSDTPQGQPTSDGGTSDTTTADVEIDHAHAAYDAAKKAAVARVPVTASIESTRVYTAPLLFAAGEMQISGEPFAQFFAGRNLNNYDRTFLPPNMYLLNNGAADMIPVVDLFGFSTAVESYEYSKYHMNMIAQQTTAGVSLTNGPVVLKNAAALDGGSSGNPGLDRLRDHVEHLLITAGSDVSGYATLPGPLDDNPQNPLGFVGLWPEFAPFVSFDSAITPHHEVVKSCTFSGGYGGIPTIGNTVPEYECAYNSLHLGTTGGLDPTMDLATRKSAVDPTIGPSTLGFATWKEALWAIDFTGRLHDAGSNAVTDVAAADRATVGKKMNSVVATQPVGALSGTFIGSTPLEGMWGLLMVSEMENAAEWLVTSLMTTDGKTLGGFASKADAIAYDYTSPLRWFPTAIKVNEDAAVPFPGVASLTIADATSHADDLAALLVGNAMFFGMTDARNAGIGQRIGLELTFDGDPFAADDGIANGEDTAHDRALAVLRAAFVDLDRLHGDPDTGVLVDTATVGDGGAVTRGTTVTIQSLAHVLIGLRQTLLSLNAAITQYGAADPDPSADAMGALNVAPIHPPDGSSPTVSGRIRTVFAKNAAFARDFLTNADGTVANSATRAAGAKAFTASTDATTLDAQAAAIRALVEGFLVTGDKTLFDRAQAVARRLESDFFTPAAQLYRGVRGGKDEVHMTPPMFAWLQSALRETHKVLSVPADPVLSRDNLEDRIQRTNKLFLNGWDDLDGDQKVNLKTECLAGRLQMGEQALTGELGRDEQGHMTTDRDSDCVPSIDSAQRASALAASVYFHSP